MSTVAGIFHDRDATERSLSELYDQGFDNDEIGVIWRDRSYSDPVETYEYRERHYADEHEDVAEEGKGAAGGAVGGAGTVLLASAGLALIRESVPSWPQAPRQPPLPAQPRVRSVEA